MTPLLSSGRGNEVKVSTREKKILYAGIAVAVAIIIYYAAARFSPGDGESLAEKVATQENLLRRQKELIAREDFYKKRIEDAEKDIEKIQARLLPVNNVAAAGTELSQILDGFAEHSGVVITQKTPQPEKKVADSDSLTKVSVRIATTCTLEDLVHFLIALKNYDRFLKVEDITINTIVSPQSKQITIRPVSMIIASYISVPPPEPAAKPGENETHTAAARNAR